VRTRINVSPKLPTVVGIVDVGIANLGSLSKILEETAIQIKPISHATDIADIDRLVLPGVGSFPEAMNRIRAVGLDDAIIKFASTLGRPILGICLGMQLLASVGEEHQITRGLGLIKGRVRKLAPSSNTRIPHIGWNQVEWSQHSFLHEGIQSHTDFYFVHSYVFEPEDETVVHARTEHGETFCSAVGLGNVYGVQFHPEKSSMAGRKLLQNFCAVV
jgi:glutamine amidotransferase